MQPTASLHAELGDLLAKTSQLGPFIFLDHIPENAVSWVTVRNYGFSDATEIFVFISGYAAVVAYSRVLLQKGWPIAAAQVLRVPTLRVLQPAMQAQAMAVPVWPRTSRVLLCTTPAVGVAV